jgi:hypothetical protein
MAAVDDLDGAGGLLAADEALRPAASVNGGVNQLGGTDLHEAQEGMFAA